MTADPTDRGEIKLHFLDYWRVIRVRLPLVVLVFLLVVFTAAIVTYFMPKQYAATVTMQIRQNMRSMDVFDKGNADRFDPRFLTTQFKIITQKEILYPVIETLGLVKKWGVANNEQAYFRLQGMVDVQEIRNTELIRILVFSTDNKEAMEIANRIAEEYKRRRISEQSEQLNSSLSRLDDEVDKQRAVVKELSDKVDKIRAELGIIDNSPNTVEDSNQSDSQAYREVESQVITERLRVASLRAKHDQISKMTDEQVMRSLGAIEFQDATIQQTLPQYQEAISEEVRLLNSGLGPNHPSVKSLHAKKEEMGRQLSQQTAVLRKTMETNLKIAEDGLSSLEQRLAESKNTSLESRNRSVVYYNAKNAYIQAKRLLDATEQRADTEKIDREMPQIPAIIWEYAEVPMVPARPNVPMNLALGIVGGLLLGVGLAFFIEYLDTSVKTMEDIETYLQVPVLAVIPKGISLLINSPNDNADAEAYRILRTNIEFNRKNPEANSVTIISGGAGEGKSTTMANLASIFAAGGYSTLIVDADLRRPSQHRIFGTDNDIGLTDFLTKDVHLEEVVSQTKLDNLYLLTSGSLMSDAVGILNSQRMVDLIEDVKHRFDIVFFDSPPILGVSDASVLSSAVDLTIIVVQHRRFPRAMLNRVKQSVLNVGGTILGVVLNNVDVRHDQHYEYYTSYYSYYTKPTKPAGASLPKRMPAAASKNAEPDQSSDSY